MFKLKIMILSREIIEKLINFLDDIDEPANLQFNRIYINHNSFREIYIDVNKLFNNLISLKFNPDCLKFRHSFPFQCNSALKRVEWCPNYQI
jgi:hypothetical protein